MEKADIKQALEYVKANSPKRKFKQSVDLIINVKDINIKNSEEHVDTFITLHFGTGKKTKVCALIGPELKESAKACDNIVLHDDFKIYGTDKKKVKKLAQEYDYFIAQANIMPDVAKAFGRVLGPKGRMPNPKAGCVVPPNANLKPLYDRLQKLVRLKIKTELTTKCRVGTEDMKDEEIIDNILVIYNHLIHMLPKEQNNIKNIMLKMTMGKPVVIGKLPGKEEPKKEEAKPEKKAKPKAENKEEPKADKKEEPKKKKKEAKPEDKKEDK